MRFGCIERASKSRVGRGIFLACCLFFGVFGRELEIGRGMNVFEDLDYLSSGYENGGDFDVFGGMGCVGGEYKKCMK